MRTNKSKRVISTITAISMAITMGVAFSACNNADENDKMEAANKYITNTVNWVSSTYQFGAGRQQYRLKMPSYTKTDKDRFSYLKCNYLGESADLYVMHFTPYVYTAQSGVAEKEISVSVTKCEDALEKAEWFVEQSIALIQKTEFIDITFSDIQEVQTSDFALYTVNATTDIPLYGYWFYLSETESYFFLSDNQEMLKRIMTSMVGINRNTDA